MCATDAPESARFCPRCHATLQFDCPACHHKQTHGGKCEKCGVDFIKYLTAAISTEKSKADATHERSRKRSTMLKHLLLAPLTGGLPLIRHLFAFGRKDHAG